MAPSTNPANATPQDPSPPSVTSTRASVRARRMWWAGGANGALRERTGSVLKGASVSENALIWEIDQVQYDNLCFSACDCHNQGSLDPFCRQSDGQCKCAENAFGRRCNECQPGFWDFPDCKPCECNGHAPTCDAEVKSCLQKYPPNGANLFSIHLTLRLGNVSTAEIGRTASIARFASMATMATRRWR